MLRLGVTGLTVHTKNHQNFHSSCINESHSTKATVKMSSFFLHCLLITHECRLVVCKCLPLCLWYECLWACWCVGKVEAVSPCQTDGYQQGSREWVLLYRGAKRLSCNLHCLSLIFSLSLCTFHLLCVHLCACARVYTLIYSLCTPICEYQCAW